ncbi:NAD-dependent epimerase/dehydratase family protein [Grimontia sp. S25]|uniref:NAD-dependent epimerase/dehydratase family protein n=1 Tax=Grimontia sedimenti TaxID=2711294 RepID=A0A6M1RBX0_9GAMM|nr:NAD-dependent epimerase/dehydratase family protein [Grimontia sedimenti]NGN97814.1 NAD-dependent epimerase/dehydratase family protein [Grimontia sedimenti]
MSKPYKTVSISGCGWLGLPLAEHLHQVGYSVTGSKRSVVSLNELELKHINGVVFDIFSEEHDPSSQPLFESDVFVANIPPGRRTIDGNVFVIAMKRMVDAAKSGGVKQFIFISTSSVYGSVTGLVTEKTVCEPNTESGKAHREIEDYVFAEFGDRGVVLRLSGLIGDQRHPGKHLAGRENVSRGLDPVNLVHREDCIQAVSAIIALQSGGETFHLSATDHPTRSAFYRWAAAGLGLQEPQFIEDGGEGKVIVADHTLQTLGMTLKYPSPFDMPLPTLG